LYCDDPEGMTARYLVTETAEYYEETDNIAENQDICRSVTLHVEHCKKHGISFNERLFLR
jgi:hypothetical protein